MHLGGGAARCGVTVVPPRYLSGTTFRGHRASHVAGFTVTGPLVRHSLLSLLALLLVVSCVRAPSRFAQSQPRDVLYNGMVGRWRGAVIPSTAVSALRADELVVVPAPERDGLELRYRSQSSTGVVERPLGHWSFGRTLDAATWGSASGPGTLAYRVVQRSGGQNGAPLSLVLEADATDANRPARIRQSIDVGTGSLSLRTEVQVDGGDFTLREAYVFRRAE